MTLIGESLLKGKLSTIGLLIKVACFVKNEGGQQYRAFPSVRVPCLTALWVSKIFIVLVGISFAVHLKHSSFWPSADVTPMYLDVVHTIQAMHPGSPYVYN
jgi:hypothetical protein